MLRRLCWQLLTQYVSHVETLLFAVAIATKKYVIHGAELKSLNLLLLAKAQDTTVNIAQSAASVMMEIVAVVMNEWELLLILTFDDENN